MAAARLPWAADLLHFWFHELRPGHWFGRNSQVDAALRRRFPHRNRVLGRKSPPAEIRTVAAGNAW